MAWVSRCRRAHPKEMQMPYSYTLTAIIPALPEEVYEAWLDSLGHSEMTGSAATTSDQVGAEVSAWEGYITGRNLELVPGERIVQSWRTSEFGDEHEDSVITLSLEPVEGGTLLTLEHSNVPDEQKSYEEGGWEANYFEPMIAYFSELEEEEAEEPQREQAPPQTVPRQKAPKGGGKKSAAKASPPGKPAKRRAASARKPKRAAAAKQSKAPAPRAKAAAKKAKAKARHAKARAAGKASARKKPARGKRN
jgi:uncharacterized protein YndB with AHSA1/START domain